MNKIRLAIYFAPHPESQLATEAADWLGRNAYKPLEAHKPKLSPLSEERLIELTRGPYHYGFHGTIKPPFKLVRGVTIEQVANRLEDFTRDQESFLLPDLEVQYLHNFFCLKPKRALDRLNELASEVVCVFDDLRMPASSGELARRRAVGLTPRQEELLLEWGYPYVMDEFRFHMTLTGKVGEVREKKLIERELTEKFTNEICSGVVFDGLSLFIEINHSPLTQIKFFPFKGNKGTKPQYDKKHERVF